MKLFSRNARRRFAFVYFLTVLQYLLTSGCHVNVLLRILTYTAVAQPTGGPRGPGPPPKPHNKIFTDYKKYETCPVNRKVKSITGSVFVFVS